MDNKNKIVSEFEKLLKQIQFDIDHSSDKKTKNINMFRLQNIRKVLNIIKNYDKEITSSKQFENIKGIGKNSIKRINEILETGKLSEINTNIIDSQYQTYIDELENVFGIGRKLALNLFTKHNIKSIEELKQLYESGKINLPKNVEKGLKYFDKIKFNIPREEIDIIYNLLTRELNYIDKHLFGTICGSYRRLKSSSNDIDFLIIHPKIITNNDLNHNTYYKDYLQRLKDIKFIIDSFTTVNVKSKFMGLCQISKKYPIRRIDIRFIPYESYYYALLYFTGSGDFNRRMRQIAIDNGYVLNEYGLYDNKEIIQVNSEKEIFDILGLEYISPDERF